MTRLVLEERTETNYLGEEEKATDVLKMKVTHSSNSGSYILSVRKETEKGCFCEWTMYANGNFSTQLGKGRKSAKKLDKLNALVDEQAEELKDLWLQGKYQEIVNRVHGRVHAAKVFA